MFWTANGMGRVRRNDLTNHHPIEEHPESGQTELYRGLGMGLELRLDKRSHVDRSDLSELLDPTSAQKAENWRTASR